MQVTNYLPVNVYIIDVNDHSPEFLNAPYNVTIDENTPLGKAETWKSLLT